MRKCILLLGIIILAPIYSFGHEYEPWGVWYTGQPDIEIRRVATFPNGKFYAYGWKMENLFAMQNSVLYDNSPAFAVNGNAARIVKYEKTDYGFLFTFDEIGYKGTNETGFKSQKIILQTRMIFENEDTCRFIIIDRNGYELSFFDDADIENKTYRRYRVEEKK